MLALVSKPDTILVPGDVAMTRLRTSIAAGDNNKYISTNEIILDSRC